MVLHDRHMARGAMMGVAAGYAIPTRYGEVGAEVRTVRERAGLFDLSHTGRLFVSGPHAAALLGRVLTRDPLRLPPGQGQAALMLDDQGGILDLVQLYRLGPERWMLVLTPERADEDITWIGAHVAPGWDARVDDRREGTTLLALSGPGARHVIGAVLSREIEARLTWGEITEVAITGHKATIARAGITGEDGFEIVAGTDAGVELWDAFMQAAVVPCGLDALDLLRLEAAIPVAGRDLTPAIDPFTAGLDRLVTEDSAWEFVGRPALAQRREAGERRRVCIRATDPDRRFAGGARLFLSAEGVGTLTSAAFSPTLAASIGMGYALPALAAPGTVLTAEGNGDSAEVVVVAPPFVRGSAGQDLR